MVPIVDSHCHLDFDDFAQDLPAVLERARRAGLVAMIEVVALMIGDIVQSYSGKKYDNPFSVGTGMFVEKGMPKGLFRPGSSTVVLIFQKDRVRFADDIVANMFYPDAESIFSSGFGKSLVETDVKVRSYIASSCKQQDKIKIMQA